MCVCVCVCVCVCLCVYIYIYIYIYTHTWKAIFYVNPRSANIILCAINWDM